MALGPLAKKIGFHRRRANRLHRMAMRRHFRAAAVARRALKAKQNGRHVRARNLMRRALRIKAMATRAGMRSRVHRARVARLRQIRAQRRAGRA
jgi:hypothetical protein